VSNVDVRSRHRGDAQQDAPHRSVSRLARERYTIGVRGQGPCLHPRAAVPAVLEDAARRVIPGGRRLKQLETTRRALIATQSDRSTMCVDPLCGTAIAAPLRLLRPRESAQ
jgi:hypothetical protein